MTKKKESMPRKASRRLWESGKSQHWAHHLVFISISIIYNFNFFLTFMSFSECSSREERSSIWKRHATKWSAELKSKASKLEDQWESQQKSWESQPGSLHAVREPTLGIDTRWESTRELLISCAHPPSWRISPHSRLTPLSTSTWLCPEDEETLFLLNLQWTTDNIQQISGA